MPKGKVLIVDDEVLIRKSLSRIIGTEDFEILHAGTGKEALDAVSDERPQIIFLDYRLPDLDGLEVLTQIKKIDNECIVIFFSAHGTLQTVVDAIKRGAFDYLEKPYQNEEVSLCLMKAQEALRLKNEVLLLRARNEKLYNHSEMIVKSAPMRQAVKLAISIGREGDATVLIEGETGVGKDLIALLIHSNSPRSEGPFIGINCAAMSKGLMESELFGYERGAFTGVATSGKAGMIEMAEGGTLFLDEVSEMSPNEQAKLLRVLENKTYYRVGGVKERTANTRVISATNRDLAKEVKEGRFRMDLYYRLNVIKIRVPPLRQRKEDIIPLSLHFIEKFSRKFNKKIKHMSSNARKVLLAHEWKGNVRELKNSIERSVLLCSGDQLDCKDLGIDECLPSDDAKLVIDLSAEKTNLETINRAIIESALVSCGNNITRAACKLGLQRGALRYRLQKYGIAFVE